MLFDVPAAWAHTPPPAAPPSALPPASPAVPPAFDWTRLDVHWSTVIGIAILAALWLWAAGPLRRRNAWRDAFPLRHAAFFFGGLVLLFFSLNGPIHDLSDTYLFSAHMVQHLLLAQAVPPLLLAGTPAWMLRPLIRRPGPRSVALAVTRVPAGYLLYSVVFSAWHIPLFYNLMMADHDVHIVMHLMVLVTATCVWWPVMGSLPELPRPSSPAQMLYLFLLGFPMMAVAAFLTFSEQVLYPWYAKAPRLFGLSPRDDQMLGGLIMWVPGALAYWVAMTGVWVKWARREHAGDAPLVIPAAPALVSAVPPASSMRGS